MLQLLSLWNRFSELVFLKNIQIRIDKRLIVCRIELCDPKGSGTPSMPVSTASPQAIRPGMPRSGVQFLKFTDVHEMNEMH